MPSKSRSSGNGGVAASSTTSLPRGREIVRTSAQIVANSPSSSNQDHPPSQHEESTARNRRHVLDDVFDDSFEDSMDLIPKPDRDEVRPRKRQKRVPHPCHEQYEQEFKPKLQRLNRLARWNYFMEFSIEGMHDIIIAAFGEISVDSYEYSYARQKIQNWTKSWKSKSLQNMLDYIREEKELARKVLGINIINVNNVRDLTSHFRQTFIPEKFYQVFYWMKDLVNVEESSDLGKFYIKNIFANLAAQLKVYDDLCDKNDNGAMVMSWDEIRTFWNEMSTAKQYQDVDRGVFKEKFRRQQLSKKRNRPAKPIAEVLSFDEDAPPKTSANTTRY